MPKYGLFYKSVTSVLYFCGAHGEPSEVLRRDESKKECVGDEDEGKAGKQGSRLWIWYSTLGSAAFGPHILGRARRKAKAQRL